MSRCEKGFATGEKLLWFNRSRANREYSSVQPLFPNVTPHHERSFVTIASEVAGREVSSGTFPSIDAAPGWAIEGMMPLANDDLEWARPFLVSGEASLARGEGIEGEEFLARLDRAIETLR